LRITQKAYIPAATIALTLILTMVPWLPINAAGTTINQPAIAAATIAYDAPLAIEPTPVTVAVGLNTTLVIKTNVDDAQPVDGVDAFITFDPAKLEVVDADAGKAGVQITPGSALATVLTNNVTSGLISYSAGVLDAPVPTGRFTVATIQFKAKAVTSIPTVVAISLTGAGTTSVVDCAGTALLGAHANANIEIVAGANVNISVTLQGGSRPEAGWAIPLTVKFFTPGTSAPVDVLTAVPVYSFALTTTRNGTAAIAQATAITPGIYDISVASPHCLTNVKRGIGIALPTIYVDMGTLLEGNANNDNRINISDFGILATAYGNGAEDAGYNAQADFDRNGRVNITDFGLLATNYAKMAPVEVR
jgi:hypothetical protein